MSNKASELLSLRRQKQAEQQALNERNMPTAPADELAHKPLDGGWGWMVVLGAHIAIGFAYSTPKTFSIFFPEIQEDLGCSYGEMAWIPSIMLATMYAGGPVSSLLVKRYGSRPIVILGGLMCGVSMVIAALADAVVYLYLCVGVIGGCGLSLNLNASLTIISKYFLVRRPLANGLAMTGSPLFLCVLAPVNQYLLDVFGWRSSLMILGALMLNCCVAGALMRPVRQPSKPSSCPPEDNVEEQPNDHNTKLKGSCMASVEKVQVEEQPNDHNTELKGSCMTSVEKVQVEEQPNDHNTELKGSCMTSGEKVQVEEQPNDLNTKLKGSCMTSVQKVQVEEQPNDLNAKLKGSCMKSVEKVLDLSIFKERRFIIYLIGSMMFIFGGYGPFMFLSAFAISQGVDEYAAASLLSITGFVDMFVRPGTGLLASNKRIRPRIQYLFSFAIAFNGMCHLLCPLLKSYALLVVYAVLLGVSFGMVFALIFECLMDLVGNERFPRVVGLVTIMECFPLLLGTPAAGLLVDLGDYSYLFLMCGSVILVAGLFLLCMNIYNDYQLKKESTAKDGERGPEATENQDHVEMQQIPEAAAERTEPEATEQNGAQIDPSPEKAQIKKVVIVGVSDQYKV